jgi:hypothetical protein
MKSMTGVNDIVLIHMEDQPLTFARIESIEPDVKPGWQHVKLLLLQIPLQVVTWILRDAYIDGAEYTMGGNRMRLERVECPPEPAAAGSQGTLGPVPTPGAAGSDGPKVISLADRKR